MTRIVMGSSNRTVCSDASNEIVRADVVCFPAWPWPGLGKEKKAEPQLPTRLIKGNSFLPVPLQFVGLQKQGKTYVPLRLFYKN